MTETNKQFSLQRLYIKDASIEVPSAPDVYQSEWQPNIDVQLNTQAQALQEDHYEVTVTFTVTAKNAANAEDDTVSYIVEVQQAGIFLATGFTDAEREQVLLIHAPTALLPFAREAIVNFTTKASFPAFVLQPINFEAIYKQRQQAQQEAETSVKH